MSKTTRGALIALVAALAVVMPVTPANARSLSSGNYGALANEGRYLNGNHQCDGGYGWRQVFATKRGVYDGRTYSLRLCYSPYYGVYARLDGAAVNDKRCVVFVNRSSTAGRQRSDGTIGETVDSNVGYAYTKVANNLDGRLAKARIICGSGAAIGEGWIIADAGWY